MSTRRPNRDGQAFHNAEPDSSLPPPPPYVPVDRTNSSANQSQAQALAQQQAARQQYAPPPGPPPGVTPPAVGQHTGRPLVSSPRNSQSSYDPSAPAAPGRPTNPFADPSSLQGAYPPMQPSQAAPPASSQQQHHASPQQGSYGMPSGPATAGYGGYGGPSAGPSSGAGAAPRRQGSIAEHARKMSADMANLNLASPAEGGGAVRRASTIREDPLELLKDFDTIFVLAAKYDRDGVDVYFLNNDRAIENCTDPREVLRVFDSIEPEGATPTGMRLEILLLDYLDRIEEYKERLSRGQNPGPEPKKRNYIVITDGSPTDDPEDVIVACARRLDRANMPLSQIGIQFLQVGDDAEATEALQDLDDALSKEHGIRDMVDTVTYSSMALNADLIIKALLGGINRRLDRKKERRA
ncbi:uncharacterized protein PSFLO_04737 [Pseudozyma flocculosa]|uniref:VWFA domain-containing protein n=1 Tax=Pseudozyma flocculosa TaxID=84751 RepID=A0A5C3F6F9_9BASI|nr:uncharacterized protein PSFLO_04737 [Pseudozyma flocculosa]